MILIIFFIPLLSFILQPAAAAPGLFMPLFMWAVLARSWAVVRASWAVLARPWDLMVRSCGAS